MLILLVQVRDRWEPEQVAYEGRKPSGNRVANSIFNGPSWTQNPMRSNLCLIWLVSEIWFC